MSPLQRLCAFWFVYLGAIGVFFPFFGLYLGGNTGLSGATRTSTRPGEDQRQIGAQKR